MKIFKYLFFFTFLIVTLVLFATFLTGKSLAQTCGGSPSCTTQEYPPVLQTQICQPQDCSQGAWTCYSCPQPYTSNDSSFSCRYYAGAPSYCTACVTEDQFCALGSGTWLSNVWDSNGNYYLNYFCYESGTIGNYPNQGYCPTTDLKPCTSGCITYCTTGTTNCGACGGGYEPANTCGWTAGSQTCQHNQPQTCTLSNFTNACNYPYNVCSSNYSCTNPGGWQAACTTNVTAHAFVDINHNGSQDTAYGISEPDFSGVSVYNSTVNQTQTTNGNGNATFGGEISGQTVWMTGTVNSTPLNGYYIKNTSVSHSITLNNSNGNPTVNFGYIPMYTISGRVYNDLNHNGNSDSGTDPNVSTLTGIQVTDGNGHTVNLQADGTFSFPKEDISNPYTVSIVTSTIPSGWVAETTSQNISVQGTDYTTVELGISKLYTLSGKVCNDLGIDGSCMQSDDTSYPYNNNVTITPQNGGTNAGSVTQAAYSSGIQLLSGVYQVSFSASNGYYFTASKVPGKTLPPFTITVGQDTNDNSFNCTVPATGSTDASCDGSGNVVNLNFALSNLQSWIQGGCTDLRIETSGSDDWLPNTGTCGSGGSATSNSFAIVCPNNPPATGIYYGGANSLTFGGNGGKASQQGYVAAQPYPENFTPVSGVNRASYTYLMDTVRSAGLTTTDLSGTDPVTGNGYCGTGGLTACSFESKLPDGIYTVNGNLTIDSGKSGVPVVLPDPGGNKSFVFLIGGTLTINSDIQVPTDSSVVFASKGDMYVSGNVGQDLTNYTSQTPDLEGYYSTEGDFWILSNNNTGYPCAAGGMPLDKRLNISGGVVVGGTVQNQRDLCKYDNYCPVTSYSTNYEYLLNAPEFIKHKAQLWQETAPNGTN